MAELVYAPVLGTGSRKGLEVRVLFWAQMKKIIITKENSGQRVDRFLMQGFFLNDEKITRGEIIRNIKSGNITVNNKTVKPSYILKENDAIEVMKHETYSMKQKEIISSSKIKFEIIYKDENIIVINKPAGLQVHPSAKKEQDTLVNGLIYKFPEIKKVGDEPENRPGIVHRLDKDTSGIMLVARNQKTFEVLKSKFKNREIQKTYWALVYGKLENKKGLIDAPLARSADYKKQTIARAKTKTKIREAVTEYKVLQEFENYSLVEVKPKTGRMHQIRIHLSSIGHSILGDEKYRLKNMKAKENIVRHLLCAKKIEFNLNGQNFKFEIELPDDFKAHIL